MVYGALQVLDSPTQCMRGILQSLGFDAALHPLHRQGPPVLGSAQTAKREAEVLPDFTASTD